MEEQTFEALEGRYRLLRRLYFGSLLAAILALALFFVDRRLTLAVLGASVVYYLLAVRRQNRAYIRAYVHTAAQATLERRLQSARHTEQPVLDPAELRRVQLLAANPGKGGVLCKEGGQGHWHGMPVQLGDVTFAHSFREKGATRHEFVVGLWTTVQLKRDTGLDWRLTQDKVMLPASRNTMYAADRSLRLMEGFGPAWTEKGWVMVRRADTPELPPPAALNAIRALADSTEHLVAVCVQGDKLHVFLTNALLGQKVGTRLPPRREWVLADRLPELDKVLAIAGALSPTA